jgi:hypothetical protein
MPTLLGLTAAAVGSHGGRWSDSACIGENDVVSVSRYGVQRATTPTDTTATVANEFGFGPSLDPVEEVEWGWRLVTL